jgi:hypothetical protein
VKTAAVGGTGKLGDVITYALTVTDIPLTDVIVTDRWWFNDLETNCNACSSALQSYNQDVYHLKRIIGKVVNTALATAKKRSKE